MHALRLTVWFNENSDFYYRYVHGDKETFHFAFRKMNQAYRMVPTPIHPLAGTMCQHDFEAQRLFQHRNRDKWDPLLCSRRIEDFWFEQDCRDYVKQLLANWNGGVDAKHFPPRSRPVRKARDIRIVAVMISCPEREQLRQQTLANLARTDWDGQPVSVEMDESHGDDDQEKQARCAWLALRKALEAPSDYILLLEDDLDFNRHIRHNLLRWRAVQRGVAALASLYNPGVQEAAFDFQNRARIVRPECLFGSQALLLSRAMTEHVVRHWRGVRGMQHTRISRLAGQLKMPLLYHAPSLVEHTGDESVKGGHSEEAMDFDPDWRA